MLILQVNKVIAPVEAHGNPFMFAEVAIYTTFNFYSTNTIEVRFVRRDLKNDLVIQLVDDSELTSADYILLGWLFDFMVEPAL